MQSKDTNTRSTGAVNHPGTEEWMDFLYGEISPERSRQLDAHLESCATCADQVRVWRGSMENLNEWRLPRSRKSSRRWVPVVKWAAAAAVVLACGFALGRSSGPSASEFAGLKASVAELSAAVQRDHIASLTNGEISTSLAANSETLRLLDEYSRLQASQRATDQRNVASALQNLDSRLGRVQSELETVAVNTETSLQQTHQNLTRLASYSIPAK